MTAPTLDEQIEELEREIGHRAMSFRKLVKSGQKPQSQADFQMACIRAALATLVRVKVSQQEGR